jgi:hypothetical protein
MRPSKRLLLSLLPLVLAVACSNSSQPNESVPKFSILKMQGQGVFFVVIDKTIASDRKALKGVADAVCKDHQSFCMVLFWDAQAKAATSVPMTDAEVDAQVASYSLNKSTGHEELLVCVKGNCNP